MQKNDTETNQNSTGQKVEEKRKAVIPDEIDIIEDITTKEKTWYNESKLRLLMVELWEFVRKDTRCIKIAKFWGTKGLDRNDWSRWNLKYPWFRAEHNKIMEFLGNRREEGMVWREMDRESNFTVMHSYDADWIGFLEHREEIKANANAKAGANNPIVFVDRLRVEPTGRVKPNPKKGKKNDSRRTDSAA